MAESRWMFTKEQLENTPSRKCGIDAEKELSYRQQAANLIQDMGQRLSVTQLCINTAIVYMHRFYMFQTFTRFPRNEMAPACLFLAAKLEEQPRKLEHVIKVAHSCLHRDNTPAPDPKTEAYLEQAQTLVINENILLQTLGFEVSVDHPHSHVVKATSLVKASKDLAQTSYFLATNSLHLTTLCLQYRPTIVACVCIYLACKWSNWKIPRSHEGKEWYEYVDKSVTPELLDELYNEFLSILEKCPHKLRKKIMGWKGNAEAAGKDSEYPDPNRPLRHDPTAEPIRHSSSMSSHHKHTNHERNSSRDVTKQSQSHPDQKHASRDHGAREEGKRDWQDRSRQGSSDKKVSADRKPIPPDHRDHGGLRKEHGTDRRDGASHDRDSSALSHHQRAETSSGETRDRLDIKPDILDLQAAEKKVSVVKSHGFSHPNAVTSSRTDYSNVSVKKEPGELVDEQGRSSSQGSASDMRRTKSETAINYKEYLKRKEMERQEKERLDRERHDREKEKIKQRAEAEQLNKTFPQMDVVKKEQRHRPPKLDMSISQPSESGLDIRQSVNQDRPYEVNIKSPIKPHHNIIVKSPIKSSELKQPKLEITKVQLTPEKDGSEPVSVNINSDPNLKRIMNSNKHESCTMNDKAEGSKVKPRPETAEAEARSRHELKMKAKYDQVDKVKQKLDVSDSNFASGHIKSENSKDFNFKTIETENGDNIPESAAALRQIIKLEPGSGRNTPVSSQNKTDGGSGTSTPVRLKLSENSPLKIKISTKGLQNDSDASSSKHDSPHRHHHKHKSKHKSHKHSKDKHRDKERHKDQDRTNSSNSSTTSHGTNNGQSLKLSFKLSDIQAHSSSSNESWSLKQKQKKESSVSDTSLNRNNSNPSDADRQQPWSVTDLITKSTSRSESESRKRRRGSNVEPNNDSSSHPKNAKLESNRIRRSSSSHSIVSMDMSDDETGSAAGDDSGAKIQMVDQSQVNLSKLHQSLQQAIDQSKMQISKLQRPQPVDRQQSGFDLEHMMWAGSGLADTPPPPPPPPALPPLPSSPPRPR